MPKRYPRLLLEDILDRINRIQRYTAGLTEEAILSSDGLKDQIERCFEVMGEAANQLPENFREAYPTLPWRHLIGLRNRIIHAYSDVDWLILMDIIDAELPELKQQIEGVLANMAPETLPGDKSLHEKCGVFGIASPQTLALGPLMYYGLYALQHRGQESCGMVVFDNDQMFLQKDMGLLNQVFNEHILSKMSGQIGIGHTRYSTTGDSNRDNAQPIIARTSQGALAIAHNGNLVNIEKLRDRFLSNTTNPYAGDSDTHMIARCIGELLHQEGTRNLPEAAKAVLEHCEGAFSLTLAMGDCLIGVRDRFGIRPLCFGKTAKGAVVIASETAALDIVGATFEREIQPGEMVIAKRDGTVYSEFLAGENQNRFCIFEKVYFARPDSIIEGRSVYQHRLALGKKLAEIAPANHHGADMVIPVPDSGTTAAIGYSQASGIPFVEGLMKNRYVGRTFINPTQELRQQGIRLKLNPLTDVIKGKKIIAIDDSIVRGNTSKLLVNMLREVGAVEVHLKISSAPVKHPCFYGIDMSTETELIANQMDPERLQAWLGVDSLTYLSPEQMKEAVAPHYTPCMACFNNDYPAGKPDNIKEAGACMVLTK